MLAAQQGWHSAYATSLRLSSGGLPKSKSECRQAEALRLAKVAGIGQEYVQYARH